MRCDRPDVSKHRTDRRALLVRQRAATDVPIVGWPSKAVLAVSTALEGHPTGTLFSSCCLRPRCQIIDIGHGRELDLAIEVPPSELGAVCMHEQWAEVNARVVELINEHRSTLIFVNTRRMAERVTHQLSDLLGEDAVGSEGQRQETESYQRLISKGIIPVEVAAKHAHRIGIKFDIYFRMAIQGSTPPARAHPKSFVRRHPEFRIVAKDGTPVEKASYAFPQTRKLMLSLIHEAMERFDVDGVSLCFTRGPAYVGYEQPVIDDFKKRYGEDPREVKEDDPLIATALAVRALTAARKE